MRPSVLVGEICKFFENKNQMKINFCNSHTEAKHWLPLGSPDGPDAYRCAQCTPPPSQAMVSRWADRSSALSKASSRTPSPSTLDDLEQPTPPYTLTIHTPAHPCPHCRSSIITEHYPSPLSPPRLRCWSCKLDITGLVPSTSDWAQSGANEGHT